MKIRTCAQNRPDSWMARSITLIVAALGIIQISYSADTTRIDGTISSVSRQPLRTAHALLYTPQSGRPLTDPQAPSQRSQPVAVAALDSNGRFHMGTVEKGQLVLRIVAPGHEPLESYVMCTGGHTIRVEAVLATQFKPGTVWDSVAIVYDKRDPNVNYQAKPLKKMGKGLYSTQIKSKDGISKSKDGIRMNRAVELKGDVHERLTQYQIRSIIRGSNLPIISVGTQNLLPAPQSSKGAKAGVGAKDAVGAKDGVGANSGFDILDVSGSGSYASVARSVKDVTKIVVNTKAWPQSKLPGSLTFLTADDATLDVLMRRIEQRSRPGEHAGVSTDSFRMYSSGSNTVREVAALAYDPRWENIRSNVPPTSMAWTIGQQRFFDLMMQEKSNREVVGYIDSILAHHPVRRIVPRLQAAVIAHAQHTGDRERSKRLLDRLKTEFPNNERTQDIRRFADPDRPIQVGKAMPAFEWVSMSVPRTEITSASLDGVHTLFVVWDSRAAKAAMFDDIMRLHSTYQPQGLRVVSVFADDQKLGAPSSYVSSFVATHPWPTVFSDGSPKSPTSLLDQSVPFMLLVGPDRSILMISGGLGVNEIEKNLTRYLQK